MKKNVVEVEAREFTCFRSCKVLLALIKTHTYSQGIIVPLENFEQGSDVILIKQDHGDYCAENLLFVNKNWKVLGKFR